MTEELDAFKRELEAQEERLLDYLARLGVAFEYDAPITLPDESAPLARIFAAVQLVADNLAHVSRERQDYLAQLQEQLDVITKQSKAIVELSTPVTEVWEHILVLPLIGTVDTVRAQQLIRDVLHAIVDREAEIVIIDITGVPVVDTAVAGHLLKTIEAIGMLGTKAILTGVSPHNAQTLVKLGVDLSRITTKGSLRAGLKLAFERTNRRVITEP